MASTSGPRGHCQSRLCFPSHHDLRRRYLGTDSGMVFSPQGGRFWNSRQRVIRMVSVIDDRWQGCLLRVPDGVILSFQDPRSLR